MAVKISAFIITKNEEKNIENCLRSINWLDEIVVVDDFSEDNTEEICNRYNVKFYKNRFTGFKDQKEYAMNLTSNDWVLEIDADERVSVEMKNLIKSFTDEDFKNFDGFEFRRKNYLWGKWIKHTGLYPDYKLRLYNKKKGVWSEQNIHEKFILKGRIRKLKVDILHDQTMSIKQYFEKTIRYNYLSALELSKRGKEAKWYHFTLRPIYTFLYKYFIRLGVLDGFYGFIISVMGAIGTFAKYMFLKEMGRDKNGQTNY